MLGRQRGVAGGWRICLVGVESKKAVDTGWNFHVGLQDCMTAALLCGDRIQGVPITGGHSMGLKCQLSLRNVEAVQEACGM